jgi:uncharacterized membrane protein
MSHAELIEWVGAATEITGVVLIVGGLLIAAWRAMFGPRTTVGRIEQARHDMGHAILLGLEVLVAADIIRTVATEPTPSGVAVLAVVVVIRTLLSWSLVLELEGRWPWQRTSRPAT